MNILTDQKMMDLTHGLSRAEGDHAIAKAQHRETLKMVFGDIDRAGLISEHKDSPLHETGATILECPACCWYAYKAQALNQSGEE